MKHYIVTYVRDDDRMHEIVSKHGLLSYSVGEMRQVNTYAENEEEALARAEETLNKQFPSEPIKYEEGEGVVVVEMESEFRPELAQAYYKLQGVVEIG